MMEILSNTNRRNVVNENQNLVEYDVIVASGVYWKKMYCIYDFISKIPVTDQSKKF